MGLIDSADAVIAARAQASVSKHKDTIIARFVAGAQKQGHDITARHVASVKLEDVRRLSYHVTGFDIGTFEVTDPDVRVLLESASWNNNTAITEHTRFDLSEVTTNVYSWAMVSGLKAGLKVSGGFEYPTPDGADLIQVDASIEASVLTTRGAVCASTHHWQHTFLQDIAPFSHVDLDIYGQHVKGQAPYTITAKASGRAVIRVEFSYHGNRTHMATVELDHLMGSSECEVEQSGIITGLHGYKLCPVQSVRPLSHFEQAHLPRCLHEDELEQGRLQLQA